MHYGPLTRNTSQAPASHLNIVNVLNLRPVAESTQGGDKTAPVVVIKKEKRHPLLHASS